MLERQANSSALLIDLDGVVYQGNHLVDGALQAIAWLQQSQLPHLYVTNTSSRSRASLLEKFEQLGFEARLDELMTPLVAANQWFETQGITRIAAFVSENSVADFSGVELVATDSDEDVDAVVIGDLGDGWDYLGMNRAFRFLMRTPAPQLVALGMTRYWRAEDGLRLDVAPFVKALEHAAGCESIVVGKPAAAFFDSSLALLQTEAAHTFMIGDDIVGDIDAAQRCGIRGIQVRTGKFREADLNAGITPWVVLESIAQLPEWWARAVDSTA